MIITFLLSLVAAAMAYHTYKETRYQWAMFWSLMLGWNLHVTLVDFVS